MGSMIAPPTPRPTPTPRATDEFVTGAFEFVSGAAGVFVAGEPDVVLEDELSVFVLLGATPAVAVTDAWPS